MTSTPVGPKCRAFVFNRYIALVPLFAIFIFADPTYAASEKKEIEGGAGRALQVTQAPAEEGVSLRFYDLLSPCSGDCQLTTAFGRYVETSMSSIFFDPKLAPWDWTYGDINFASLTFGRKVADFGPLHIARTRGGGWQALRRCRRVRVLGRSLLSLERVFLGSHHRYLHRGFDRCQLRLGFQPTRGGAGPRRCVLPALLLARDHFGGAGLEFGFRRHSSASPLGRWWYIRRVGWLPIPYGRLARILLMAPAWG